MQSLEKKLDILDGPTYQEYITEYSDAAPNYINPANTNFLDEIFKSAPIQNMNLNVSGGNETSKYALSLGYLDQEGFIRSGGPLFQTDARFFEAEQFRFLEMSLPSMIFSTTLPTE